METTFPRSSRTVPKFELTLHERQPLQAAELTGVRCTPFQAVHGQRGGPFFSDRRQAKGRTLAHSGDTEWNEERLHAAHAADLFVAEACFFDKKVPLHLDLARLPAAWAHWRAAGGADTHE